jgi:hypothetical protein
VTARLGEFARDCVPALQALLRLRSSSNPCRPTSTSSRNYTVNVSLPRQKYRSSCGPFYRARGEVPCSSVSWSFRPLPMPLCSLSKYSNKQCFVWSKRRLDALGTPPWMLSGIVANVTRKSKPCFAPSSTVTPNFTLAKSESRQKPGGLAGNDGWRNCRHSPAAV